MKRPKRYLYSRSAYELTDAQVVYRYADCNPVSVEYIYLNRYRFTKEVVRKFKKI